MLQRNLPKPGQLDTKGVIASYYLDQIFRDLNWQNTTSPTFSELRQIVGELGVNFEHVVRKSDRFGGKEVENKVHGLSLENSDKRILYSTSQTTVTTDASRAVVEVDLNNELQVQNFEFSEADLSSD